MTKRRRTTPKKKRGATKRARKARAPKIDRAALVRATLDDWCDRLRQSTVLADAQDKPKGACMAPDPAGGAPMCVFTDRDTCKALRGTFLGGPC